MNNLFKPFFIAFIAVASLSAAVCIASFFTPIPLKVIEAGLITSLLLFLITFLARLD